MKQNNQFIKQYSSCILLSIVSKLLSMLITVVLLFYFGTNRELDIFITVSSFIYILNIVVEKVYVNIVPPMFLNLSSQKEKKQFVGSMIAFSTVISISVFFVFLLGGSVIVKILAPGFSYIELNKSTQIIKILSMSLVLNMISAFLTSYLRTIEKISPIYFKEILINLTVLFCVYFFNKKVTMLSIYYVIAYIIAFIYICRSFISESDFHLHIDFATFKMYSGLFVIKGFPVFLTTFINEIKNIVDRVFASYLQGGAISALNFSYRVIGIPVNIFGGVLINVIFTRLVKASKTKEFSNIIIKLSTIVLVVVMPLSFFVLFKSDLIASIFTEINRNIDLYLLSSAMKNYSFCILGNAMLLIMNNIFYAQGKTKSTMYIALVVTILNILFNSLFISRWGVAGIAFATTLASLIAYIVSLILIERGSNDKIYKIIISRIIIIAIITIPSIIYLQVDFSFINSINNLINKLVELLISGIGYMAIYLIAFYLLNKFNKELLKIGK